jgi:hypothetical protein
MLQHIGQFWLRIPYKEQCENNGASLPYFADLAPADFYLFPCLKSALKGRHFGDAINIIGNTMEEVTRLSQNGFQECSQHLYSPSRSV